MTHGSTPTGLVGDLRDLHELPVIGEPVPLELVNTAHTWEGVVDEALPTRHALRAWCAVVLGTRELPVTPADLAAVHRLREAIALLVEALRAGEPPDPGATAVVDVALEHATPARRLAAVDGRLTTVASDPPTSIDEVLGRIALATVELVEEASPGRLRGCANPPCGMVFLAGHGRRRYCTPECSNDDRQRRYRQRHRPRSE